MREIKFRVWNKAENEFSDISEYGPWYWFDRFTDPKIPKTLTFQQYTGLKDKNGVEIYEGDILKIAGWRGASHRVLVKWERVDASDDAGQNMVGFCCFDQYGDAEVIGNIFETPELLKA